MIERGKDYAKGKNGKWLTVILSITEKYELKYCQVNFKGGGVSP